MIDPDDLPTAPGMINDQTWRDIGRTWIMWTLFCDPEVAQELISTCDRNYDYRQYKTP